MARGRSRVDGWDVAAFFVVTLTALLYAREIANDFLWGHDGGNGAPYWNAAENTVRFGVLGQAKGYTGLVEPSSHDFYTHHPPLLHLHLVLARALFGRAEAVGRLVPLLYSVGTLALLYRVTRALQAPAFALLALVLYALTPLHLIFASMIDHEQGGIFWALLATYAAVQCLRAERRRDRILAVLASTAALQWGWGSYFVLAVVGASAVLVWSRARRPGMLRDRARWLSLALLVTGLANVAAFFVHVWATKGTLSDMHTVFALRSSETEGYAHATFGRALDMYGPLLVCLTAAGIVRFGRRLVARRVRVRDIVPVAFLLGQLGLSLAFRNAGRLHVYWTYHLGVACAWLGADALLAAAAWVRARLGNRGVMIAAAITLVLLARTALAQQQWGLATGHASYAVAFDDQFEQVQLAKWLHARYGRDVTYMLHASLNARVEVQYYLDAPIVQVAAEDALPTGRRCPTRTCVFVADLRTVRDKATMAEIDHLVASHAANVFGAHLVAIELTAPTAPPNAYRLESHPRGALHRWFVSDRHPPSTWALAGERSESFALSLADLGRQTYVAESSKTGRVLSEPCPRGLFLVGVASRTSSGTLTAVQGLCGRPEEPARTGWLGEPGSGDESSVACASNEALVGISFPSATTLAPITLRCAPSERIDGGAAVGGKPGYTLTCPAGMVAVGLRARRPSAEAVSLGGIGIGCASAGAGL